MNRRGFTLVELLVAISIILVMLTLTGVAYSAARNSMKITTTRTLVHKLADILAQHMSQYDSMAVSTPTPLPTGLTSASDFRTWHIRRNLMCGDMPNDWLDVKAIYDRELLWDGEPDAPRFPLTASQRAYRAWYENTPPPTNTWADAECLFLIIMLGGIGDCLACEGLRTSQIGDTDGDGAMEFLDAWGNPIGFVLLPVGLTLPPDAIQPMFTSQIMPTVPSLGLRPLVYSWGPDRTPGLIVPTGSINKRFSCGDPADAGVKQYASWQQGAVKDDITNFDLEVRR